MFYCCNLKTAEEEEEVVLVIVVVTCATREVEYKHLSVPPSRVVCNLDFGNGRKRSKTRAEKFLYTKHTLGPPVPPKWH